MSVLEDVHGTSQVTRDSIGARDSSEPVLKRNEEKILVIEGPTRIKTITLDLTNSFILDHSTAGILGTDKLGRTELSNVISRVVNPNSKFKEYIRTTDFKDTGSTTATWDIGTYEWDFVGVKTIQTLAIYDNNTDISKATLTILTGNITTAGNLTYYLSADGGSNWETVTNGNEHTFTNTGQDLRLKITSSGNATIDIDASDGHSTPIEVSYV